MRTDPFSSESKHKGEASLHRMIASGHEHGANYHSLMGNKHGEVAERNAGMAHTHAAEMHDAASGNPALSPIANKASSVARAMTSSIQGIKTVAEGFSADWLAV